MESKNDKFPRACTKCGQVGEKEDFTSYPYKGKRYFRSWCKPCIRGYDSNRERPKYSELSETQKQGRRNATAKQRIEAKIKGTCIACYGVPAVAGKVFCASCADRKNARERETIRNLRMIFLDHYGHICVCCPTGTAHPDEFLAGDHIGGWGKDHRTATGRKVSGVNLYRWAINNNFPDSLRVLCYNCNCSQAHAGYCPHEKERAAEVPQ